MRVESFWLRTEIWIGHGIRWRDSSRCISWLIVCVIWSFQTDYEATTLWAWTCKNTTLPAYEQDTFSCYWVSSSSKLIFSYFFYVSKTGNLESIIRGWGQRSNTKVTFFQFFLLHSCKGNMRRTFRRDFCPVEVHLTFIQFLFWMLCDS